MSKRKKLFGKNEESELDDKDVKVKKLEVKEPPEVKEAKIMVEAEPKSMVKKPEADSEDKKPKDAPKVMVEPKTLVLDDKPPKKPRNTSILASTNPTQYNKYRDVVSQKPSGAHKYFRSR